MRWRYRKGNHPEGKGLVAMYEGDTSLNWHKVFTRNKKFYLPIYLCSTERTKRGVSIPLPEGLDFTRETTTHHAVSCQYSTHDLILHVGVFTKNKRCDVATYVLCRVSFLLVEIYTSPRVCVRSSINTVLRQHLFLKPPKAPMKLSEIQHTQVSLETIEWVYSKI